MKVKINKTLFLAFFILIQAVLFIGGISLIRSFSLKNKAIHNELVAWENKDKDNRLLQDDYQKNIQAIEIVNQALPTDNYIISFFEELENIASKSGAKVTLNMTSLPVKDEVQKINTYILKLNVRGTFGQINSFVKDLESYDQLIIVKNIVYNSPKGLTGELVGNILIKTFFAL